MRSDINAVLTEGFTEPIRDMLWGHIYMPPGLAALTKSPAFMRLHRIYQLGPVYLLYPGATHTRAAHSIGVYHLSRRLLLSLANRGADQWITATGSISFLCAALLHDIGHFPYTHSLKELPLQSHEALSGTILLSEPLKSLLGNAGADPYFTAAIIDTQLPAQNNTELRFYRKLLSGVLDPDKLDYLNRDARHCGVPYGAQDVDFILDRLIPHPERGVDIDSRGIPSIESILFSKYLMYRSVYWHRIVRSATAMIKKALLAGITDGVLSKEELYHLDDHSLFSLMETRPHELFDLAVKVKDGQLYPTIAEFPFDESIHQGLLNPETRSQYEHALALDFSAYFSIPITGNNIIIDIPEPVSFETGLYVTDEKGVFSESTSAFKSDVVNTFVNSLRIIRIFIDPSLEARIKDNPNIAEILHIKKKWLHLI